MAAGNYPAMVQRDDVEFDLREIDERILDMLEDGRCTRQHLASELQVSGDYIYQRVDLMHKLGIIDVIHDGFYQLVDEPPADDLDDIEEPVLDEQDTHDPEPEPVAHSGSESDAVQAVVERVSESWADPDERLEARRAAARAVLQHALDTGDAVGKSDAIDQFLPDYAVDGQNDESWWRKNIRPVLSEVGDYSNGKHGYVVEDV